MKDIAIQIDELTPDDWAFVGAVLRAAQIDPETVDWSGVGTMPPLALAALIHVSVRRDNPHATYRNSARMAFAALGVG